ncbi:MAG: phosphatase PAP2 family protein [Bacteroidota bacterium]
MRKIMILLVVFWSPEIHSQQPLTGNQRFHKNNGDILVIALPSLALGSTFIWQDGQKGTYQFSKALTSTLALSYGLKFLINKERPNGENKYSFPSAHTSVAFSSAAFIQRRYGWEYGLAAYALASYVGFTRIKANKHDGWDVLAGAAIGTGMGYLFSNPFDKDRKFQVSTGYIENTLALGFTYKF